MTSRQTGKQVTYRDLPAEEYADIMADSDVGIARGDLNTDSGDLRALIGRPTTPLASALKG